jgi:hypothetical protein
MTGAPIPASHLRLKRAYGLAEPDDGVRILVDRLWPRRVSKARAALDDWIKEVAPAPCCAMVRPRPCPLDRIPVQLSRRAMLQ